MKESAENVLFFALIRKKKIFLSVLRIPMKIQI